MTPAGQERLRAELAAQRTERHRVVEIVAWAAGNGDRSENADYQYGKRRLRQIDGRIRFLTKRIEAAEVVDPEAPRAKQAQGIDALQPGAEGAAQALEPQPQNV